MNANELKTVLAKHAAWLAGEEAGVRADLRFADLTFADLRGTNLKFADLRSANLRGANLVGADIDFACWPLWCGSMGVIVDAKIVYQLAAHMCALSCADPEAQAAQAAMLPWARRSHCAGDLRIV